MTFNCDQIVIFDLEATCWEGREHFHKYREVIALGACILDLKTLTISNKFNVVCKPIRSEISEYCTRITGITKEQAENNSPKKQKKLPAATDIHFYNKNNQ
jgi:inhibitor of KinA sporulation pathway (predicted exonuclease)